MPEMSPSLRRRSLGILTAVILSGAAVAVTAPGTAQAGGSTHAVVYWNVAGVYSRPWGTIIKDKHKGECVTTPTNAAYFYSGGDWWIEVNLGSGGTAYMRRNSLYFGSSPCN